MKNPVLLKPGSLIIINLLSIYFYINTVEIITESAKKKIEIKLKFNSISFIVYSINKIVIL